MHDIRFRTSAVGRATGAEPGGAHPKVAEAKSTRATTAGRKQHLRQVDLMRVTAFLTVVLVHVTGTTYPLPGTWPSFAQLLMHSMRMVFFFVSTFVLFHTWYERPLHSRSFVLRRLRLIGLPYLAWSVTYWAFGDRWLLAHDPHAALHDLREVLTWGAAWYHLYFLLVSLQIGVLFPVFRRIVRATRTWHGWLLAGSAVVQAVALAVQFVPHPLSWGPAEWYRVHGYVLFPTYAFFLVGGALAAVHLDAFHGWVTAHTRLVLGSLGAALVLTYACFRGNIADGESPVAAANALQPATLVWGAALVTAMYAACAWWARRAPGGRAVAFGVELAFGVYLVHPLVLRLLETYGVVAWLPLPALPATIALWAIVVAVSGLCALLIGRWRVSSWLVGR